MTEQQAAYEPPGAKHNQPPSDFEVIADRIETLYDEAKQWLDGEPISTQGQADDLSNLRNMIAGAEKEAKALLAEEVEPHRTAEKAVRERYAPLIADTKAVRGMTVRAIEAIKEVQRPWEMKLAEEQAARERKAREEAEAARRAAEEAARKAQQEADSLAAKEAREAALAEAEAAEKAAKKVERDKPKTGGGIGRATHLRTYYYPILQNAMQALAHYAANQPQAVEQFLLGLAQQDINAGKREIPGFEVVEEKKVV